mmetsp:Transcript_10723/g.13406  ORF Transcript_10723/g.13406 Transcript_10723/m.13406 type:complete len:316 (-) Transcript_10723:776-1723(-)|eukprot:CAMPEP_0204830474 /NCGR_PEP_ID=MMETSP1346-20131115/8671_1 /ASSEMBLY_ACC=CAM_ASM_000771 /TAXON_ID=215587 /ORGANISM="Aplanochytrium stocchinoi, Strain GSBS06" /LENGTH=315 /DNA_ID=CAMNT_0051960747 /DNA_START=33 /DNA_END=980 /DNA_ORIENTATION=+
MISSTSDFGDVDGDLYFFQRAKSADHLVLDEDQYRLKERNVIIIGDVHGCFKELKTLIESYVEINDLVIFVGDLINKGPNSLQVLRYAREHNFVGVVGNHEITSIRSCFARRAAVSRNETEIPYLKYEWTDSMDEQDIEYILSLPFTISIPYHNAVVVHAGLVPGVPLFSQNPKHMATMRNLHVNVDGTYEALESVHEGGKAWASLWKGPEHVYFGHDAKRRMQKYLYATGLDTGCLYGDQLSAAILSPKGHRKIVHVDAAKAYVQVPAAHSVDRATRWRTRSITKIQFGLGILIGCTAAFGLAYRCSFQRPKGE